MAIAAGAIILPSPSIAEPRPLPEHEIAPAPRRRSIVPSVPVSSTDAVPVVAFKRAISSVWSFGRAVNSSSLASKAYGSVHRLRTTAIYGGMRSA